MELQVRITGPSRTSTGVDVECLTHLNEKRDRPSNMSRKIGISDKSIWQALQRLSSSGYVQTDEFGVYTITEKGRSEAEFLNKDEGAQKKLALVKLYRNSDKLDDEDFQTLRGMLNRLEGA